MKSTLKFSISPEGERSMQPVVLAHIYRSDDARDSVAEHFRYRMGLNHNFLIWERIPEPMERIEENFFGQYCIKNYRPDSLLSVLDSSSVKDQDGFCNALESLCKEWGVETCFLPEGRQMTGVQTTPKENP